MNAERITESDSNDQLLYFTSTSLLAEAAGLVFISDRTGDPNLFHLDFASGETRQLTHNTEGTLKSYVYFSGTPYRGFGKASVSLDPDAGVAYFVQGRQVRVVDIEGRERVLAEVPDGEMTAFSHVSADGSRLCVPTTDARALDGVSSPRTGDSPPPNSTRRGPALRRGRPHSGRGPLLVPPGVRHGDGQRGREIPVPRAWITHVQFSPDDSSLILYNHEYCSEAGVRRMWLWDGARHRMLRDESPAGSNGGFGRARLARHEMWERDGAQSSTTAVTAASTTSRRASWAASHGTAPTERGAAARGLEPVRPLFRRPAGAARQRRLLPNGRHLGRLGPLDLAGLGRLGRRGNEVAPADPSRLVVDDTGRPPAPDLRPRMRLRLLHLRPRRRPERLPHRDLSRIVPERSVEPACCPAEGHGQRWSLRNQYDAHSRLTQPS